MCASCKQQDDHVLKSVSKSKSTSTVIVARCECAMSAKEIMGSQMSKTKIRLIVIIKNILIHHRHRHPVTLRQITQIRHMYYQTISQVYRQIIGRKNPGLFKYLGILVGNPGLSVINLIKRKSWFTTENLRFSTGIPSYSDKPWFSNDKQGLSTNWFLQRRMVVILWCII